MFERIFACLFHLYPSQFRKAYEGEARQLLAERLRDEKGLFRRLRLMLDLANDFAVGLPRAYRTSPNEAAATSLLSNAEGIPSFHVLEEERIGPGPFLGSSAIFLAALCIFSFVMSLPGQQYVQPGGGGVPILGDWQGPLLASQRNLQTVVKIGVTNAGALHIELFLSGQSGSPLLATSAGIEGRYLKFAIQSIGARFEGSPSADGMSIVGVWTQAKKSRSVLLERMLPALPATVPGAS